MITDHTFKRPMAATREDSFLTFLDTSFGCVTFNASNNCLVVEIEFDDQGINASMTDRLVTQIMSVLRHKCVNAIQFFNCESASGQVFAPFLRLLTIPSVYAVNFDNTDIECDSLTNVLAVLKARENPIREFEFRSDYLPMSAKDVIVDFVRSSSLVSLCVDTNSESNLLSEVIQVCQRSPTIRDVNFGESLRSGEFGHLVDMLWNVYASSGLRSNPNIRTVYSCFATIEPNEVEQDESDELKFHVSRLLLWLCDHYERITGHNEDADLPFEFSKLSVPSWSLPHWIRQRLGKMDTCISFHVQFQTNEDRCSCWTNLCGKPMLRLIDQIRPIITQLKATILNSTNLDYDSLSIIMQMVEIDEYDQQPSEPPAKRRKIQ